MARTKNLPGKFHDQFQRMVTKYNALEEKPQDYGCGVDLYPAEIHAISAIGDYPQTHMSEVARILGVTRGATQQMVERLLRKGLVEKFKDEKNGKKVYLKLTTNGQIAFRGHEKYHMELVSYIGKYFESLGDKEIKSLMRFFDGIEIYLEDYYKKKFE